MNTRRPTIDDVQAAMRGCQMRDMTQDELRALRDEHKDKPLFASQVIAQAAALLLRLRS